jgi:hypothetical protein
MYEFIKPIITPLLTGLFSSAFLWGIFYFYFRKRIEFSFIERDKRIQYERETMLKFLEIWYNRRSNVSKDSLTEFTKSLREIMLWCPNNVLYHLGMYLSMYGKPEAEEHFGKAVLCYRRTLGYKNRWWRWWQKVTPEHIVLFYEAGNKGKLE